MANIDNPMGFRPVGQPLRVNKYRIEAGYATDLFINDVVHLSGGYVVKGTNSGSVLGSIVGFVSDHGADVDGYYPANSPNTYFALVADHPEQLFIAQDDGDGTAIALTDIGKTGKLITTTAGNTTTNISGMEADGSTFSGTGQATTDQFRLVDLVDDPNNAVGAHADWIFAVNNHVYRPTA
jgi:hypothetical protein